jgi:hypothetical protein
MFKSFGYHRNFLKQIIKDTSMNGLGIERVLAFKKKEELVFSTSLSRGIEYENAGEEGSLFFLS